MLTRLVFSWLSMPFSPAPWKQLSSLWNTPIASFLKLVDATASSIALSALLNYLSG
jgi:hypothetical protein